MSDDYAGVHTCHANCTKWYCLLRKENQKLRGELDTMTAKFDYVRDENAFLKDPSDGRCMEIVALREHAKKLRAEIEHLKKRIEFDNQTLEATCKRLEKTHASWMIVKADNAKLQESVLAEHQAAVDMFSKYDALRDENTQLKDEVGQLRQQIGEHTCDPNVLERLAYSRMKAVVELAKEMLIPLYLYVDKECGCEPGNAYEPEFICGTHELIYKSEDALKALDDGSAG